MKKIYKIILLTTLFICSISLYACKEKSAITNKNYSVSLDVGSTYLIRQPFNENDFEVQCDSNKIGAIKLGKCLSVDAKESGEALLNIKCNKSSIVYKFIIQDTVLSTENNGLTISTKSNYNLVMGITSPIKIETKVLMSMEEVESPVTFGIEHSDIASVTKNGEISAVSVGNTVLTLQTTYNGQTVEKKCVVNVFPNADLVLDQTNTNLFLEGEKTKQIEPTLYLGSNNELTQNHLDIKYYTSDEKVAKVSDEGKITASGIGRAEITVDYFGLNAKLEVNVYNKKVEISNIDELRNVEDNNYYILTKDLSYTFKGYNVGSNDIEEEYIIEKLNSVLDGDGYKIAVGFEDEVIHREGWLQHEYNFNLIKEIMPSGILRNMTIDYYAAPQNNVLGGSGVIGTNNGGVEDIILNMHLLTLAGSWYTSFYVNPGSTFYFISKDGFGTFKNMLYFMTGSSWQMGNAQYKDSFRIVNDGLKMQNVLLVAPYIFTSPTNISNVKVVENTEQVSNSGFSFIDFNMGDKESKWAEGNNELPVLKRDSINEVVEIKSGEELIAHSNDLANFVLINDITINLSQEEGVYSKAVINTLKSVFDGCGHTVNINIVGKTPSGNHDLNYNFIGEITNGGILRNTKIVYKYDLNDNMNNSTLVVGANNGKIQNCEISVGWSNWYWINATCFYLGVGTGSVNNCIIIAEGRNQDNNQYYPTHLSSGLSYKNTLIISDISDTVVGENVYRITNTNEYSECGYDDSVLNINQENSYWITTEEILIPFLGEKPEDVEISKASDFGLYTNGTYNYILTGDITFDLTNSSAIDTLSTVIDGQGHTITINVNSNTAYNFITNLNGVVKNAKIIYNYNGTTRLASGTKLLCGNITGTIKNCEIIFKWSAYPGSEVQSAYLGIVHGSIKNCVIAASELYGEMTLCWTDGKFENVLLKSTLPIPSTGTVINVVALTSLDGYSSCGFDDSEFNVDKESSCWTAGENGIPEIKQKIN